VLEIGDKNVKIIYKSRSYFDGRLITKIRGSDKGWRSRFEGGIV